MTNLIDEFVNLCSKYIDTPEPIIRACGYWLISALMGKYVRNRALPNIYSWGNLYVIISTDPGFFRRSTIMSATTYTFRNAYIEFLMKTNDNINLDEAKEQVDTLFCDEFTVEGLIDHLTLIRKKYDIKEVHFHSSEFGGGLERMKLKHLAGTLTLLSKLYYGESHSQVLSRRGGKIGHRYIPPGFYSTLFMGSQKLDLYIDKLAINQGFLRRCLIVYCIHKDLNEERYKPIINEERKFMYDELKVFAKNKIVKRLMEIYNVYQEKLNTYGVEGIDVMLLPKVVNEINQIDRKIYVKYAKTGDERLVALASIGEIIEKLAILEALADLDNKPMVIANDYVLNVKTNNFENVKRFWSNVNQRSIELVEKIITKSIEKPIETERAIFTKITQLIKRSEKGFINIGQLQIKIAKTKDWLKPYLVTLLETGDIYILYAKRKGAKGRPPYYIFIDKEKIEKVKKKLEEKGWKVILFDGSNAELFRTMY